jgi:hypothetical protein
MNATRCIRIATGTKRIELGNDNIALLQIREVLIEHRQVLIDRLISDLPTYLNYKFSIPATKEQLDTIKDKLTSLKRSNIGLGNYSEIIGEILVNETTYVKSEPFYFEINEVINEELNPAQLMLVK